MNPNAPVFGASPQRPSQPGQPPLQLKIPGHPAGGAPQTMSMSFAPPPIASPPMLSPVSARAPQQQQPMLPFSNPPAFMGHPGGPPSVHPSAGAPSPFLPPHILAQLQAQAAAAQQQGMPPQRMPAPPSLSPQFSRPVPTGLPGSGMLSPQFALSGGAGPIQGRGGKRGPLKGAGRGGGLPGRPPTSPALSNASASTGTGAGAGAGSATASAAANSAQPAKPKRKVVVSLPVETPGEEAAESGEEAEGEEGPKQGKILPRPSWARNPLPPSERPEDVLQPPPELMSRTPHPEPIPRSEGLPPTIDIYLPGQAAWAEYNQARIDEKLEKLGIGPSSTGPSASWMGNGLGRFGGMAGHLGPHGRSMSISSPADPNMVSFKLNRYLQSQAQSAPQAPPSPTSARSQVGETSSDGRSGSPSKSEGPVVPPNSATGPWNPFDRSFQSDLPPRLRDAMSKSSTGGRTHGQTMSLSVPASGGPFGPSVLSAMGLPVPPMMLEEAGEEAGELTDSTDMVRRGSEPGLSEKVSDSLGMSRNLSEGTALGAKGAFAVPRTGSRSQPTTPMHGRASSYLDFGVAPASAIARRELGRGFGYDIEEVSEPEESVGRRAAHSRHASRRSVATNTSSRLVADEMEDGELRTNPSDDEAGSQVGETAKSRIMHRRHSTSEIEGPRPEREDGDEEIGDGLSEVDSEALRTGEEELSDFDDDDISDGEFSNPSDEDRARQARLQRRMAAAQGRLAVERNAARVRHKDLQDTSMARTSETGKSNTGDAEDDFVSNPSDDERFEQERIAHKDRGCLSQDFKFPPRPSAPGPTSSTSSINPPSLNARAPEFVFGTKPSSPGHARMPARASLESPQGNPYRLPSISSSSFGSSTLGPKEPPSVGLSATAPEFTPTGNFTFTAPGPKLPVLPAQGPTLTRREAQGREKRQKTFGIQQQGSGDGEAHFHAPSQFDALASFRFAHGAGSPPRPSNSAASIEGPMRDDQVPKPAFNPAAKEFTFKAHAPPFMPTLGRSAGKAIAAAAAGSGEQPSAMDTSRFSFTVDNVQRPSQNRGPPAAAAVPAADHAPLVHKPTSKAIPIVRPDSAGRGDSQGQRAEEKEIGFSPSSPNKENTRPGLLTVFSNQLQAARSVSPIPERSEPPSSPMRPTSAFRPPLQVQRQSQIASVSSAQATGVRTPMDDVNSLETMSDASEIDTDELIEELGERVEKSLEGWAAKILDEVTILGQVRPALSASMDIFERDALVDGFAVRVEKMMEAYHSRLASLHEKTTKATAAATAEAVAAKLPPPSSAALITSTPATAAPVPAPPRTKELDAEGELDFDYVQEVLEGMNKSLIREMTDVILAARPPQHPPAELSFEASESLSNLVTNKLRPLFASVEQLEKGQRQEIVDAVESILEENFQRSQVKAAAERQEVAHVMADRIGERLTVFERILGEERETGREQTAAQLINSLLPHLDSLKSDTVDPDQVAARVVEILAPMIKGITETWGEQRALPTPSPSFDSSFNSAHSREELSDTVVEKMLPFLNAIKMDPIDTDTLVKKVAEIVASRSIEHLVDLSPVTALLEPLVAKQDEVRRVSKALLAQHHEVESTLGSLPGAINAKTEIFLASSQEALDKQEEALNKQDVVLAEIRQLKELSRASSDDRVQRLEDERERLIAKIEEMRAAAVAKESESADLREKLSAAEGVNEELRTSLEKLEGRLGAAENDVGELTAKLESFREREEQWHEAEREREKHVGELNVHIAELRSEKDSSRREAEVVARELQELRQDAEVRRREAEQMRSERAAEREEAAKEKADWVEERAEWVKARADFAQEKNGWTAQQNAWVREREEWAQEKAEWSKERAEWVKEKDFWAQERAEMAKQLQQARGAESELRQTVKTMEKERASAEKERTKEDKERQVEMRELVERSKTLEGETSALVKRIASQDEKIGNLQRVTATQKQQAAQAQQRLSEADKKTRDYEDKTRELDISKVKIDELTRRLEDKEGVEAKLKASQESENKLREELSTYHNRFLELEKDLITMKENLVGRDELEAAQAELAAAREECAQLRGQLAAIPPPPPPQNLNGLAPPYNNKMTGQFGAYPGFTSPQTSNGAVVSPTPSSWAFMRPSGGWTPSRSVSPVKPSFHGSPSIAETATSERTLDESGWWS